MKRIRVGLGLLSLSLFLMTGCAKQSPLAPQPSLSARAATAAAAPNSIAKTAGAATVLGDIGPGAHYALFRPADWNGSLVLYIHGYVEPDAAVALPDDPALLALRSFLLAQGFAVAYSSFSQNGLAVEDGALWSAQVCRIFASKLGSPRRTFLVGPSMGGLIAVMMAEKHPELYTAALPMSGIVGGTRKTVDYHANVRVLFDAFYPGVLPGSLLELPSGLDVNRDIVLPAVAAMQANPQGALAMSQIVQTPIPFSNGAELLGSIAQSLVFQALELEDLLDRTHGHSFFENRATVYTGALPPELLADLNARVARYGRAPDADAFLERGYEPSGRLSIPVLTLHAALDPVAPVFLESAYHDRVASAGRLGFLAQRQVVSYGHYMFPPSVIEAAFEDLVHWVDTGSKPSS